MKNFDPSGNSSFRPTQNATGISENHHTGINRLVKLSLVIEGKVIKYYKHFKLIQSAQRHHEFGSRHFGRPPDPHFRGSE